MNYTHIITDTDICIKVDITLQDHTVLKTLQFKLGSTITMKDDMFFILYKDVPSFIAPAKNCVLINENHLV